MTKHLLTRVIKVHTVYHSDQFLDQFYYYCTGYHRDIRLHDIYLHCYIDFSQSRQLDLSKYNKYNNCSITFQGDCPRTLEDFLLEWKVK